MPLKLQIDKINFSSDCCTLLISIIGDLETLDRSALETNVKKKYPKIGDHPCINSRGKFFGDCIKTTSLAHVFEHCVLCELAKSESFQGAKFLGQTQNLGPKLAKITLKYYDDIRALRSIKSACENLNEILKTCTAQD